MWYYNQKNALKILSSTKRMMNTIVIQFSIMIIVGGWFGLFSLLGTTIGEYSNCVFYSYFSIIAVLLFIIIFLLCRLFTRKLRHDIKYNKTIVKEVILDEVRIRKEVNHGNGILYIPILGHLFPNIFGKKTKSVSVSYLITNDGNKYYVPLDLKSNKTNKINLHFGERSDIYLGCSVILD